MLLIFGEVKGAREAAILYHKVPIETSPMCNNVPIQYISFGCPLYVLKCLGYVLMLWMSIGHSVFCVAAVGCLPYKTSERHIRDWITKFNIMYV